MDFECPESLQMLPTFLKGPLPSTMAIENPYYSPSHFTSITCLSITMQHSQLNKKMTRNSRICGYI